nr:CoA-transferase [Sinorhizobium sp. BJ1]
MRTRSKKKPSSAQERSTHDRRYKHDRHSRRHQAFERPDRLAQDIFDGAYVNLGIGFPETVARYQPEGRQAIFRTENGILDFGEAPPEGQEDWDLINAGKKAVTLKPGSAFFHHADSFAMVRGGHLDVAILGA